MVGGDLSLMNIDGSLNKIDRIELGHYLNQRKIAMTLMRNVTTSGRAKSYNFMNFFR